MVKNRDREFQRESWCSPSVSMARRPAHMGTRRAPERCAAPRVGCWLRSAGGTSGQTALLGNTSSVIDQQVDHWLFLKRGHTTGQINEPCVNMTPAFGFEPKAYCH